MKIKNNTLENIPIDKLNFLPFNRSINTEQVNKLMGSLESFGKLRMPVIVHTSVIDGNLKYYIVDGQHMISGLMRFNEEKVQCIVFKSEDKYEIVSIMATLNNIVCTWSFKDYINAYASLGDSDYLRLRAHYKTTGFTPSISSEVLGNRSKVRKGNFKANNNDADKLTEHLIDICSIVSTYSAHFMKGFIRHYRTNIKSKYNHKKTLKALRNCDIDFSILSPNAVSDIFKTLKI